MSKEVMVLHNPSITALFIAVLYFQTFNVYRPQRAVNNDTTQRKLYTDMEQQLRTRYLYFNIKFRFL